MSKPSLPERLHLTYWTSLEEPRSCLRKDFPCILEEFKTFFNGILTLKNVKIDDWKQYRGAAKKDIPELTEIRLGFDRSNKPKASPWT